jgi:hypothetical protein
MESSKIMEKPWVLYPPGERKPWENPGKWKKSHRFNIPEASHQRI